MEKQTETYRYKDFEVFKLTLAMPPLEQTIETRKLGGGKTSKYLKIEVIQATADRLFRTWEVMDEKYMNVLNEVVCTVKISAVPDYPNADIMVFTGSASKPIQCEAKSDPAAFPVGKFTNALEYCLPASKSEAIGDAFGVLGNIFGRNLNRKASNDFGFNLSYGKPKDKVEIVEDEAREGEEPELAKELPNQEQKEENQDVPF